MKAMVYLLAVLVSCTAALAQGERPDGQRARDPERDRAALRARLEARLEETRQLEERLRTAIERLDAGEDARDVRAEAEIPPRFVRREFGRRGPGGPGGPENRAGLEERGGPERGERADRAGMRRGPGPDREAMLRHLEEHAPDLAQRLREERDRNPVMFERILNGMESRLRLMMAERDREMRDLRRRELIASWDVLGASRGMTEVLRAGGDAGARGAAAERLRSTLAGHFDVRLAMHEREIAMLEHRLGELREEMERHLGARDEMVDRRVEMIVRMAEKRAQEDPGEGAGDERERRDPGDPQRRR